MSDALKIVPHDEPVLAKKAVVRVVEPPARVEFDAAKVDPSRLMDMLGDIDGLKHEIQERMSRIEAVKQAKTLLMEDAARTEALTKRLAEIGKMMTAVQSGVLADELPVTEPAKGHSRDVLVETELRPAPVRVLNEGVALPWPRPEDGPGEEGLGGEAGQWSEAAQEAIDSALQRVEQAEEVWQQAWKRAEAVTQEAQRLMDESAAQLHRAAGREEEAAAEFEAARAALASAYESSYQRLAEAEEAWKQASRQAFEVTLEAKRLMDDSTAQLHRAVSREEEASAEFRLAREALASTFESSNQRLVEAEFRWKQAEQAAEEARRIYDETTARLSEAESRGNAESAGLSASAQMAIEAAVELAVKDLQAKEESWKQTWQRADENAADARLLFEEAAARLKEAESRSLAESAGVSASAQRAIESALKDLQVKEESWKQTWERAAEGATEARRLFDEATARLTLAETKGVVEGGAVSKATQQAIESSLERLLLAEEGWKKTSQQADAVAVEAKRLFDEAKAQLDAAVSREEMATRELRLAQEALAGVAESQKDQRAEAERSLQQSVESALEAKRVFEETTAKLNRVLSAQENATADFQAFQKTLTASYQTAVERLGQGDRFAGNRDDLSDVRQMWDLATAQLAESKSKEEAAAFDLNSARQELTTAYQFAAVAAQRRLDSVELFSKASRWMLYAIAVSWVAMVWFAWIALKSSMPIWVAGLVSVVIVAAAVLVGNKITREA